MVNLNFFKMLFFIRKYGYNLLTIKGKESNNRLNRIVSSIKKVYYSFRIEGIYILVRNYALVPTGRLIKK